MKILGFPVGPLQANAYLAICEETHDCALVDPGEEAELLIEAAADQGAEIVSILLTHAHLDHVGGVATAKRETGSPVYLHPADSGLYSAVSIQAQSFGLEVEAPPQPDGDLEDGQIIEIGARRLEVRHTPGHSPGHVCLIGDGFALVGDCVFAGSIGRTDLPGGDYRLLMESINEKLLTLPDDTVLYTGHGPTTTVFKERTTNPFLTGAFGWSG